jgi:HEAT repeat protein
MARIFSGRTFAFCCLGFVGLGIVGCASFWDDVTSHEFKVRDLYSRPDPMTVLRTKQDDGDALAKAMHRLEEPRKHGGSDQDQQDALQILGTVATTDARPLCRLASIDALGRFEDVRSAPPLIQAYHNASAATFTPDHVNAIRCQALAAMGHKNQPEVMTLLVQAAAAPPESKPSTTQQASFTNDLLRKAAAVSDAQSVRESRLAAVRALGETHNPQAIPHLLPLLQEKDTALRDRAQEALQKITGKNEIPAERQAWESALAQK